MDHLHDELDEADLKFLQKFGQIEDESDSSHDFVDDEGVEQAQHFEPHSEDAPKMEPTGEDGIDVDVDFVHDQAPGEGGQPDEQPEGEFGGEQGQAEGEAEDFRQGELNQEAEQEGLADPGDVRMDDIEQRGKGEGEQGEQEQGDERQADAEGESDTDAQQELEDFLDQQGEGDTGGDGEQEGDESESEQPEDSGEQEKGRDPEGTENLTDEGEGEPDDDAEDKRGERNSDQQPEGEQGGDEQEQPEGQGERNERQEEDERGECDGNCAENDQNDPDAEPCPYCTEKKRRQQQRLEQPTPIALDSVKAPIFVGDEVESCADGHDEDEFDRYTAVVMGVAFGHKRDAAEQRMIVVRRRDGMTGGMEIDGERNAIGWGVRSNLCTIVKVEQEQQERQHQHNLPEADSDEMQQMLNEFLDQLHQDEQKQQDEQPEEIEQPEDEAPEDEQEQEREDDDPDFGEGDTDTEEDEEFREKIERQDEQERAILTYDVDDNPVHDGDRVEILVPITSLRGSFTLHKGNVYVVRDGCIVPGKEHAPHPGIVSDKPAEDGAKGWRDPDSGMLAYTFIRGQGNVTLKPCIRVVKDGQEDGQDEPEQEQEQERKSLPLTKQQEERFGNLFARIAKKSQETFGSTLESAKNSELLPGGVFEDEALGRYVEIESRGVRYRVVLTASRIEEK